MDCSGPQCPTRQEIHRETDRQRHPHQGGTAGIGVGLGLAQRFHLVTGADTVTTNEPSPIRLPARLVPSLTAQPDVADEAMGMLPRPLEAVEICVQRAGFLRGAQGRNGDVLMPSGAH